MDKFKLVSDAAVGTSGKEAMFGGAIAVMGIVVSEYLGGWDKGLQILVALMVADYVTGVLGAIRTKTVNSETMFWGGIRKGVVIMAVALSSMIDQFASTDAPIFRTLAIYFYAGREGLSVVENLGVLGVPLPPSLTRFLEQLQEKGEKV